MGLSQSYRDFKRIRLITTVLMKYELGWLVHQLKLRPSSSPAEKPSDLPRRLRLSMEELGGTFVKLGQVLSVRPDLLPKEYCEEFSKLQDNLRPIPFDQVKTVVESELKKPLKDVFEVFSEVPVASASVGQVHKARLKSGATVAVKVQRPNIAEIFEADIDLLYHLAALLENHIPDVRQFHPTALVEEFERYTKNELDYLIEARHVDSFHQYYKNSSSIVIPKVFWEATSKRVLTMDFIDGEKISEVKNFNKWLSSRDLVLKNITSALTLQVVDFGMFHADPHPGNILLVGKNKIAFLDFGIVGVIPESLQEKIGSLFIAVVNGDREGFANALIALGFVGQEIDEEMFRQDLSTHLGKYRLLKIEQFKTSDFLYDVLALVRAYDMKLPLSFVLLIKAIITTEGLGKMLDPNYNFIVASRPLVNQLIHRRASPTNVLKRLSKRFRKTSETMIDLPEEAKKTLTQLRSGHLKVSIEDPKLDVLGEEIDRSSNRVTFGILIAAFVVGAALVILANIPPFYKTIPLVAIGLLIMAACTLIFLIISIMREKKR